MIQENRRRWERFYRWHYPLVVVLGQILGLYLFAVGAALLHKTVQHGGAGRLTMIAITGCAWIALVMRADWRSGLALLVIAGTVVGVGVSGMPPSAWASQHFSAGLDGRLAYTCVTHLFLHSDWTHLANNVFSLLTAVGVLVWSGVRLPVLGIIAGAAMCGDLIFALTDRPDVCLIGISGVAYGLTIAAALRSIPTAREHLVTRWHLMVMGVAIWAVGLGGLVPDPANPRMSYQAHLGGTFGGMVSVLCVMWWQRRRKKPQEQPMVAVANEPT